MKRERASELFSNGAVPRPLLPNGLAQILVRSLRVQVGGREEGGVVRGSMAVQSTGRGGGGGSRRETGERG